jgi:hypothetical protein
MHHYICNNIYIVVSCFWNKLFEFGVNVAIIFAIIAYYDASEMVVINGNDISPRFRTTNGVRQGGILSPKLYNIYSEKLIDMIKKLGLGIIIVKLIIGIIMYADDLTLIADNEFDLQEQINAVGAQGEIDDIKFNAKNSMVMIFNNYENSVYNFSMYGNSIPIVDEARYLGYQLSTKNDNLTHVLLRKKKAVSQVAKIKNLGLMSNNLSPQARSHLFKCFIRPVILYGIDACDLSNDEIDILQTAEGNALKNCIGVNKQVRTKPIMATLNVEPTSFRILRDKINLFGRLIENRLMCRVLYEFNDCFQANSPSHDMKQFISPNNASFTDISLEGIFNLAQLKLNSVINDTIALNKLDTDGLATQDKLKKIFTFYKDKWYIFRLWECIGFTRKNKNAA